MLSNLNFVNNFLKSVKASGLKYDIIHYRQHNTIANKKYII